MFWLKEYMLNRFCDIVFIKNYSKCSDIQSEPLESCTQMLPIHRVKIQQEKQRQKEKEQKIKQCFNPGFRHWASSKL